MSSISTRPSTSLNFWGEEGRDPIKKNNKKEKKIVVSFMLVFVVLST